VDEDGINKFFHNLKESEKKLDFEHFKKIVKL
jgi:hypothetical protein